MVGHASTQINKVERLELLVTNLETDLNNVKADNKKLVQEKTNREHDYQEASRVIGEQQRKVTESAEKIRVLEGLAAVEEATKVAKTADEWEEVWEDDNTGNLVPQRRKEVDRFQWKPELACK